MYKVGDRIVYGQAGVMTIVDIREEKVLNEKNTYYVLRAHDAGEGALTFVPTDNEELVSLMRPLMTKEEIEKMIIAVKESPDIQWIEDTRARSMVFKKIADSSDFTEILRMIRSIEEKITIRTESGKRSYLSDEIIMKKAKKRVYSEFSAVLDLDYEQTDNYIRYMMSQK